MNRGHSILSGNLRPSGSSPRRTSPGLLPLSKALIGFSNAKYAEGLSPRSVVSYSDIVSKWIARIGDKDIGNVTAADISDYLAWLRTEYKPQRFNGKTHPLSAKTIRNVWITLSSFFRWAQEELSIPYPMSELRAPRAAHTPVEELTREQVERILRACTHSREASTPARRAFVMRRPTAGRDTAVILVLLDTGLRASELCSLKVEDVDLKTGKIDIKPGAQGGAKGGKGRAVYLGRASRRAVWLYLSHREDGEQPDAPLFVARGGHAMRPNTLLQLVTSIAKKADVANAYPHKLRHTFAITYLRSGGDIFTLQQLLGHLSLEMVRRYSNIAAADVAAAHRKASPVDNWRL